ncbi:hypothetical protein ABZ896_01690 [Streptomyces sp. NPDC047072]|uniref:hypothetical protein n=1 Tax=Streptomyces sp. NPDC047072 TaxID=3154809 RepID=UPI0033FCE272
MPNEPDRLKQVWQAIGTSWQKVQFMDPDDGLGAHLCLGDYGNGGVYSSTCDATNGVQQWKLGF